MKRLLAIVTLGLLLTGIAASADIYSIKSSSINCGGGVGTSSAYTVNATAGQAAVGFSTSQSFIHWAGFWAGEIPTPTVAATPAAAKMLADGAFISIAGKIATTSSADFTDCFYIEEMDRFSGIRVSVPTAAINGLNRGSVVNVIGTMATAGSGERQISGPVVIIVGTHAPLGPLGMVNRSVGGDYLNGQCGVIDGNGLNNIGLLIQTWGTVIGSPAQSLLVNDGSGTPVMLDTAWLASPPEVGSYVSVVGVSSIPISGNKARLIIPRNSDDVIVR